MDARRPKWCSKCKDVMPWTRLPLTRNGRLITRRGKAVFMRRCNVCNGTVMSKKPKLSSPGKRADALWSELVKRGRGCFFAGRMLHGKPHECGGPLEAMHGIPRGYYGTRWSPENGFAGCRDLHHYFSRRKEEWSFQLAVEWGDDMFRTMWEIARNNRTKEPVKWLKYLQGFAIGLTGSEIGGDDETRTA